MKRVRGNGRRSRSVVATTSLVLAFVLTVAAGTGRSMARAQDADAPGGATLRVLHGVSDAGPLDLSLDGALALIGTTFPSVSDPLPVTGGEPRLVVAPSGAGADAALLDAQVEVGAGTTALLALFGSVAEFSAVLYPIDTEPIAADTTRVRVIHGSLDAGPVDPAIVGGDVLFPTLEYLDGTTYAELPAGSYAFELRAAGTADVALDLGTVDLAAGAAYDLVAAGQVADGTLQPLVLETTVEIAAADDETADDDEATEEDDTAADDDQANDEADVEPAATTRPVALRAGGCADPTGDVVAELQAASPPGGAEVGTGEDATVEQAFSVVPVPFETITGDAHVVTVGAAGGADGGVAACGGVAGRLTADGALVVALRAVGESGVTGVAVLAPNVLDPTTTDVSVFLTPITPSQAGAEAANAALEAAEAEAVTAAATPNADGTGGPEVELIDATPFAE